MIFLTSTDIVTTIAQQTQAKISLEAQEHVCLSY
jgi:hypothetical protein